MSSCGNLRRAYLFNVETDLSLRSMIEHFQDLQIRPQAQRLEILELLTDLMSKHRDALKETGDQAIVGVTDLVSGEKDPRNLMVIFSILKVVMVEWDVSGHAEVCSQCWRICQLAHTSRRSSIQYFAISRSHSDLLQMTPTALRHKISRLVLGNALQHQDTLRPMLFRS